MRILCLLIITIISLLVPQKVQAQETYAGVVSSIDGEPVSYANVILLTKTDSTYFLGTTTDSVGKFSVCATETCWMRVTHIGFDDAMIAHPSNNMKISLTPNSQMLEDVVVKPDYPTTQIVGDALSTRIRGTILEKLGTAVDVLGQLPGVINEQGVTLVLGKGSPTFYINGRQLRNMSELQQLRSERIKYIDVVTNPGSRYGGQVNAVIRIYADRIQGEGVSTGNYVNTEYNNYLTGGDQLNLTYRRNGLEVFGMADYSCNKAQASSKNVQNTWLDHLYRQDIDTWQKAKSSHLDLKAGASYEVTENHSLGIYYEYTNSPSKSWSNYGMESFIDNILEDKGFTQAYGRVTPHTHLIDGYYSGRIGKWTLDILTDIYWTRSSSTNYQNETTQYADDRVVTTYDNTKAQSLAGEFNASHPFWNGSINFGTQYTHSRWSEEFVNTEGILSNLQPTEKETNAGMYIETSQQFGKLSLMAGLRYEYIDSKYYEEGMKVAGQSRSYSKLLPSLTVSMPIGEIKTQLSYSRKYTRPLYSQLNSTVNYINRYMYACGNPNLRTTYINNVSLNIIYRSLVVMLDYKHVDDKIITVEDNYNDESSIILQSKGNSPYCMNTFQTFVSWRPHKGKWYGGVTGGMAAQFYKAEYCGELKRLNNPIGLLRMSSLYVFSQKLMAGVDLNWLTDGNSENGKMSSRWNIDLSATYTLSKHWKLKANLNDIFNTSRDRTVTIYMGKHDLLLNQHTCARNMALTLSYDFNVMKSKYKGKGTSKEERERL